MGIQTWRNKQRALLTEDENNAESEEHHSERQPSNSQGLIVC